MSDRLFARRISTELLNGALAIAKKPRRRPTAGPPPIKNPRHEAKLSDDGKRSPAAKKLPAGAPVAPTLRSVVVRSVLVSAVSWCS